jgi:hypothetical protein
MSEQIELIDRYTYEELRTIKEVKDIYTDGVTAKDAWLFLSLRSEHGTNLTLDDLELILVDQHNLTTSVNGRYWVSILIVYPDRTSAQTLHFAEVMIDMDDISWLRDKVRETLVEVEASQYGNT